MKSIFKKIWNDSVLSKVIAIWVTFLITTSWNIIAAFVEKTTFKSAFNSFWTFRIELWLIAVVVIAGLIITSLFIKYSKKPFIYDIDSLNLDRSLFNEIRNIEGMSDLILEVKSNGFSTRPVEMKRIETLIDILELSKRPDFEFLNPNIEVLKKKLIQDFEDLESVTSNYIFGTGNSGWLSIPSEWEYNQAERWEEAIRKLSAQEDLLTISYQNFISKGRNILRV